MTANKEMKPLEWEYFCDESYYHLWCVRKTAKSAWGECFHVQSEQEAKGLTKILNNYYPPTPPAVSDEEIDDLSNLLVQEYFDTDQAPREAAVRILKTYRKVA